MTENNNKKRKRKYTHTKPYDSISYTTGDVALNIGHFNRAMGTESSGGAVGGGLTEAKRYVRRYYIRPQNIFCSNKAEILKALIELDDANCSVYTLNNLGDEKDVSKLMNNDIIYYYDNGILYDKNKVKVMDYDLSIKKEEKRKHFANVNKAPDKEFKQEYSDRMTGATELEENIKDKNILPFTCAEVKAALEKAGNEVAVELGQSFNNEDACGYTWEITRSGNEYIVTGWGYNAYTEEDGIENSEYFDTIEEAYTYIESLAKSEDWVEFKALKAITAFDLDFDDVNVYGEKLTEAKENFCCICGEPLGGYGNNPEPFMAVEDGRACDSCNLKFVLPARLDIMEEN